MVDEGLFGKALGFGKWLFGAIGLGTALKFAKDLVNEHLDMLRIRKQIYTEMADNYEQILERLSVSTSIEGFRRGTPSRFIEKLHLTFDVHEFQSTANRTQYFKLEEVGVIESIYDRFSDIESDEDSFRAIPKARIALAEFDKSVRRKKLNLEVLKSSSTPHLWEYVNQLVENKRESHEKDVDPY